MRNYIKKRIEDRTIKFSTVKDGSVGVWIPVNKNNLIKELE
jgi:hypothetical protein